MDEMCWCDEAQWWNPQNHSQLNCEADLIGYTSWRSNRKIVNFNFSFEVICGSLWTWKLNFSLLFFLLHLQRCSYVYGFLLKMWEAKKESKDQSKKVTKANSSIKLESISRLFRMVTQSRSFFILPVRNCLPLLTELLLTHLHAFARISNIIRFRYVLL